MGKREGLNENLLYVIDSDYRVMYCNEVMKELYPELIYGAFCYESFKNKKNPCGECPLRKNVRDEIAVYHDVLGEWMGVRMAQIQWQEQECYAVIGSIVSDINRNILQRVPYMAGYDVVFQMNLTNDTYRKILNDDVEQKIAESRHGLRDLILSTSRRLVSPLDRGRFLEFWDLDTMMQRVRDTGGALCDEFRERGQWGGWDIVRIVIVQDMSAAEGEDVILTMYSVIEAKSRVNEVIDQRWTEWQEELDPLTGLPGGKKYQKMAVEYLGQRPGSCCMVAIDIENFRFYNLWYGRESGDELLCRVAMFLKEMDEEYGTLSGYAGGDDFYSIFPYSREMTDYLCSGLTRIMGNVENAAGFRPVFGACRIGAGENKFNDIYDHATIALNRVIGNREINICWYDDKLIRDIEEEFRLIPDVKRGMMEREFVFYAQPKYSLSQKKIVGAEALIRWNHRDKGLIPPGKFIPVLEKNGFITELDKYLWEEVCQAIRGWLDRGFDPVPISVNVSRRDFQAIDVPEYFRDLIRKYELEPYYIEIEITESVLAYDEEELKLAEQRFRDYGFRVLIDDFGSGYSSLNMLKDVRADVLKLDIRFLDLNESNQEKGISIMRSVFEMADSLQMPVIAEGVETEKQLETLRELGCDLVQGYYFYRPMSLQEYELLFI